MTFTLEHVVPWGRSFDEYRRMFALGFDAAVAEPAPEHPAAILLENVRRRGERVVLDRLGPRLTRRLARLVRRG
jgi:hypothetical protein